MTLPGLVGIKIRADFLRIAAERRKAVTPGFILQAAPRPHAAIAAPTTPEQVRVGFTASRKVGIAVTRNRAKRRLRAIAAAVLPESGRPGTDYVLIARSGTEERSFAELVADLRSALARLHRPGEQPAADRDRRRAPRERRTA